MNISLNVAKVDLLSRDWCNQIFEGRNKDYGAYQMRRGYARRLTFALIGVIGFVALLLLAPFLFFQIQNHLDEQAEYATVENLSKMSAVEMLRQQHLKAVATAVRPRMRVEKNSVRFVPSLDSDAGQDIRIGTDETEELSEESSSNQVVQVPDSLQKYVNDTDPVATGEPPSALQVVEEMPQFPGGLGALMRWLEQNVRYPAYCVQQKIEGEVRVSFIVDKKGNILEPKIVQPVHPFLDSETLRCVRHMPQWKPGLVGGKVGIVRVTIPVVFQLN